MERREAEERARVEEEEKRKRLEELEKEEKAEDGDAGTSAPEGVCLEACLSSVKYVGACLHYLLL